MEGNVIRFDFGVNVADAVVGCDILVVILLTVNDAFADFTSNDLCILHLEVRVAVHL